MSGEADRWRVEFSYGLSFNEGRSVATLRLFRTSVSDRTGKMLQGEQVMLLVGETHEELLRELNALVEQEGSLDALEALVAEARKAS